MNNKQNTTIFFEFNRDKDKKAPSKIEQIKEVLNLYQSLGAIIVISSLIFATYQTSKN